MPGDVKRIDIAEFRRLGILQELNRQFLHPLGLALEVMVEADGSEKLGGIWDYRQDPEGMLFSDAMDPEKARYVRDLRAQHADARVKLFGFHGAFDGLVQPLNWTPPPTNEQPADVTNATPDA